MTEKLTQYAKRKAKLTPEQIEYEKAQRRKKDRERYARQKEQKMYSNRKTTARAFIRDYIKDEDKEEFKKLLEKL